MEIGFTVYPHGHVPKEVIDCCSFNFSNYYGIWRDKSKGKVKLGSNRLAKNFLADESCQLAVSFDKELSNVVGHVFFKTFQSGPFDKVVWITQLVVRPEYRRKKIAQTLLHAVIGTNCACAGIVSSHPYAVRALEKAMGRKCDPDLTRAYAPQLVADSAIGYLQNRPLITSGGSCLIDTDFDIDHKEPLTILAEMNPAVWKLGELPERHEFLCIVFSA